jgi:hypothetical protein
MYLAAVRMTRVSGLLAPPFLSTERLVPQPEGGRIFSAGMISESGAMIRPGAMVDRAI